MGNVEPNKEAIFDDGGFGGEDFEDIRGTRVHVIRMLPEREWASPTIPGYLIRLHDGDVIDVMATELYALEDYPYEIKDPDDS